MARLITITSIGGKGLVPMVGFLWLSADTPMARSASSESEIRLLKEEGPKAWAKYQQHVSRYSGTILTESSQDGEITTQCLTTFRHNQRCSLFEYQHNINRPVGGKNRPRGQLLVTNPQYAFEMVRGDANAKWAIVNTHLDLSSSPPFFSSKPPDLIRLYTSGIALQLFFPAAGLGDLLRDSDLQLRKATRTNESGLIRYDFTGVSKWLPERKEWMPITAGHFVVSPSNYWLPVEVDIKYEFGNIQRGWWRGRHEYQSMDDVPILLSTRYEGVVNVVETGKVSPMTFKANCSLEQMNNLPDSEFTLSHFGFTEPVEKPGFWKRSVLWLLGSIALLLGLVCLKTMGKSRSTHV